MRLISGRALVTGGSRGIGRAVALKLAAEGADVVISYHKNVKAAQAVVKEISDLGRRSKAIQADTSSASDVERLVSETEKFLGGITILVNNAGVLKRTPFLDLTETEWDTIVDTNLKGYFLVGHAVAHCIVSRHSIGTIINVSSAGQAVAAPNLTHYCVAKAGVEMLTKQMALELAPYRIRVNAVAPGLIETDMNRDDLANLEFRNRRLSRIPLGKIGVPEDVVSAIAFLASESESRLVTGTSIYIDGGQTIWGA